ncbi:MAG TPA: adenylate/guanylate cyclase domain-containing protein [Steroidobacteraceae bacterium]|nr:adenylate/guanylate cyclase domain-containing protein [Steroidobacteraceae bacterium]
MVDAVRCAIEMQNGMVERNPGLPPERRIEFRIGIHVGDVVAESDGDLMGDGVNIAARLEGIAKPGSICLSEDAYRQVKSRLPSPVRFTTRPLCTAMVGSIRSLRSARKRARVRSSSALVRRLYPTTSAARMAASFRVSAMAVPSTQARLARLLVALDGLFRLADHCSPASN